jgi:hypothetical protein
MIEPSVEQRTPVERAQDRFARAVEQEFAGVSPLYARLAAGLAGDAALCALAAQARPDQPLPVFFLGAVHYLLRQEPDHPLAAYYPDLAGAAVALGDPYPLFHAFCLEHQGALVDLLTTRRVQTNEVQRCACLLPAFGLVAARGGGRPLALVEVGASAGLNLLWDRYGYRYSDGTQVGDPAAPVQIACTLRGAHRPPLPATFPPIASRVGLDLNPVDLRDPDALRWLRALIWPEQANRAALLEQAVAAARADPPHLLAGDALARLPEVFAALPLDATLCVWHSWTLNQFPRAAREQFVALLAAEAARREVYDIWMESFPGDRPHVRLLTFRAGERTEQMLAYCSPHGYWLEWVA